MDRGQLLELAERMLDLVERGTTEQGDGPMTVAVDDYRNPERWQAEMDEIFAKKPLLLAFGGELRDPGDYKSMDVLGTPVLLIRQTDGSVKSFLNVCRHRGAIITEEGCDSARRHSCPYHGWTYDTDGTLVGFPGKDTFGDIDQSTLGLTELPAAERAGVIFGQTTPGLDLDIDNWLGGLDGILDAFDIGSWHMLERTKADGPNWKICYDGYLEGYHFASLHKNTLHPQIKSNVMAFDSFGPHQRVGFARQDIDRLKDKPKEEWEEFEGISMIVTFFPHCSLVISEEGGFLSQLWPGATPESSWTTQSTFRKELPKDDDEAKLIKMSADFLYMVVKDEDYATGHGIQRGVSSGAAQNSSETFVFGANELGNQRFHSTVAAIVEGG